MKKIQASLLILSAFSSTAFAQTQEGTLIYGSGPSPVPGMGGVMILVLALLIFAVNFRVIRRRIRSPLLTVLGASLIAGLFSITGGQLISDAYAPPFTPLSNPDGGTVPVYGNIFNSFRNTSGTPQTILSITLPSECADFPEFTTNNCSENFLLASNESCDIDCRQGQITINKTVVGTDTGFTFAATYDQDGFILSSGQSDVSQALQTGSYTISETVPAGYALTDISCPGGYSSTIQTVTNGVQIDLVNGEKIACTFTNTELSSITVEKQTVPDGSPDTFNFSGNLAGSIADGDSITHSGVLPGQYSSTEVVPSPWALTGISCDDNNSTGSLGNATANFVVEAGEDVICTFTNTRCGAVLTGGGEIRPPPAAAPTVVATFTGIGPWQVSWTDGVNNYSQTLPPVASNPWLIPNSGTTPGLYQITSVTDNSGCTSAGASNAVLVFEP